MGELERAAGGLREAVTAEKFAQVEKAAVEYARLVVQQWHRLAAGSPEAKRLSSEALELLTWALETTRARRTALAARLVALRPLLAYIRNQRLERPT